MQSTDFDGVASAGAMSAVFARVSAAASSLLPHEEALFAWFTQDARRVTRAFSTRSGECRVPEAQEQWLLEGSASAVFGSSGTNGDRPRTWVRAPLRIAGRVAGTVVFYAGPGREYGNCDLQTAQWLADVVAALVTDGGADVAPEVGRPADAILDPSEEVLRELADVIDVRSVFPRISAIVNRVLPHDWLTMTFHDAEGYVGLQVSSKEDESGSWTVRVDPAILAQPYVLLPELTPEGLANHNPPEAREMLMRTGYRSFLALNVRARQQRMGVEFWSYRPNGFSIADVPLARHVAICIAMAVSHEQLIAASREPQESHIRTRRLETRVDSLVAALGDRTIGGGRIVGQSKLWTEVVQAAARVAETDATVLLIGESGTGKEIIARFVHASSERRNGPFVAVNCAALPEQLLESELFGYERGAFTGASHTKPGQIELAAGGVLFLDEVSEMSMSAQAKFLRVLQEREFRHLGGTRLLKADVRVIAATNTDLHRAIQDGHFRRDLYYRLRVFDLRLPSLRERRDDIPALSAALLEEIGARLRRPNARLTPAALAALVAHDWPGNVRELRNVLERAAILAERETIDVSQLSFDTDSPDHGSSTDLGVVERDLIEKVLRECGGNKSKAAKRLGLSRMQLYVRLRRYYGDGEALN
jgi:transcriptional regulator with GAF, ATPase, and Fis domain